MKYARFTISPGALLLISAAYFFDGSGVFSAILPAILAHEMGHIVCLKACGARIRRVSVDILGLKLDYSGRISEKAHLLSIMAGPAFGALYAICSFLIGGTYFLLSAGFSLLLTLFNLIPALPLDGGRAAFILFGRKKANLIAMRASLLMLLAGLYLLFKGSFAPLLAGTGLMVYSLRPDPYEFR